jgi:cation transport ATPase
MARWIWWILRSIIFSAIIFAFMYYFIYLGGIPHLWEGTANIFTMNTMVIVSIMCGLFFSAVITFVKGDNRNKNRR